MILDRVTRGQDIFFFCFYMLRHIEDESFSIREPAGSAALSPRPSADDTAADALDAVRLAKQLPPLPTAAPAARAVAPTPTPTPGAAWTRWGVENDMIMPGETPAPALGVRQAADAALPMRDRSASIISVDDDLDLHGSPGSVARAAPSAPIAVPAGGGARPHARRDGSSGTPTGSPASSIEASSLALGSWQDVGRSLAGLGGTPTSASRRQPSPPPALDMAADAAAARPTHPLAHASTPVPASPAPAAAVRAGLPTSTCSGVNFP